MIQYFHPPVGIYSEEMKSLFQKDVFIPLVIAALFRIATVWKHNKCLSIDAWIKKKKMWYLSVYLSIIYKIILFNLYKRRKSHYLPKHGGITL